MVSSRRLILSYTIQQVIPNICTKFQNPRCNCSWEIFDTNFPYVLHWSERWKNGKWRQKLISASWFSFPQYTWPLSRCIKHLKTLALIEANNLWQKFSLKRKKTGQIKEMISRRRLILSYTIQEVIPNICTGFQNPRFSSSWEIFDEKKSLQTHPKTNIVTEKTKTIYPLYTSYKHDINQGP